MRIITGIYRGKKILSPTNKTTRPTLQRAKETMFNLLPNHFLTGRCLDIFSGTGQLALEAISRGANFVVVNDWDYNSHIVLRKNFSFVPATKYQFQKLKYLDLLNEVKDQKFTTIFVDPPYSSAEKMINNILTFIDNNDLLETGGYIIGEIPSNQNLNNNYQNIELKKLRLFSKITKIWIYGKK